MLVGTLTNILVKKFLGRKFIPRFAKYLIKFPDYLMYATFSSGSKINFWCEGRVPSNLSQGNQMPKRKRKKVTENE